MDNLLALFPSLNVVILVSFIAAYVLHLLFIRNTKLLIDIVAVYMSLFIVAVLPLWYDPMHTWLQGHVYSRILLFAVLVIGLHILLSWSNIKTFSRRVHPLNHTTSFVYRVAIMGLIFAVMIHILPDDIRLSLSGLVYLLFSSTWSLFAWLIFPLILAFTYKYKTQNGWLE